MRAILNFYQTIHRHVSGSMLPKQLTPRSKRDALPVPAFPEVKDYFLRNLKWVIAGGVICVALAILKVIKSKLEQNQVKNLYDPNKDVGAGRSDKINLIPIPRKPIESERLNGGKPSNLDITDSQLPQSGESQNDVDAEPNRKTHSRLQQLGESQNDVDAEPNRETNNINLIPILKKPIESEQSNDPDITDSQLSQSGESQNSLLLQPLVERKNEEEETPWGSGPDSPYSSLIEFAPKPVPTGVVNFDQSGRLLNLCYLISNLQLLRMGFDSRITALIEDEEASPESRELACMLKAVINKISAGEETVNAAEIMGLANYLISKKMVDTEIYEQACAIELMQTILGTLNVSLFPIQKGYQDARVLQQDDVSHLILNLKHSGKIASTLNEALNFWAIGEPNEDGKIQVSRLQASSLPDVLMVVLNRRTPEAELPMWDLSQLSDFDEEVQVAIAANLSEGSGKITTPVEMPNIWQIGDDYLDVAPISSEYRPEYQLHGFIIHTGESGGSGHYFAYTLESDGQWYCLNDDQVKPIGIDNPELKKHQNTGVVYLYKKIAYLDDNKVLGSN